MFHLYALWPKYRTFFFRNKKHILKEIFYDYYCCCSVANSCLTLCDPMDSSHQAPLSSTVSWSFLKFMSIESVMLSTYLTLCHPLLLLFSIFASIRVFSSELALHIIWPKYWSFSFNNSPSNKYSSPVIIGPFLL